MQLLKLPFFDGFRIVNCYEVEIHHSPPKSCFFQINFTINKRIVQLFILRLSQH
jgi:hypothetical protein